MPRNFTFDPIRDAERRLGFGPTVWHDLRRFADRPPPPAPPPPAPAGPWPHSLAPPLDTMPQTEMPPTLSGAENPQPYSPGSWLGGLALGALNPLGVTRPPVTQTVIPGQDLTGDPMPPVTRTTPPMSSGNPEAEMIGSMLSGGGLMGGLARRMGPAAVRALGGGAGGIGGVAALTDPGTAQAPDPRRKRIGEIDADVLTREAQIRRYTTQPFRGRTARERDAARAAAIQTERDAIGRLTTERTRLSTALEGDAERLRLQEEADARGAAWRNTPTNRAYPGAIYGTGALGTAIGAYLPFRGARRPMVEFNARTSDIERRWRTALDRANDPGLSLTARRQAAQEAIGLRAQHQAALAAAPGHLTAGDRARSAVTGAVATDFGLMLPDFADYVYSFGDPAGPLHTSSQDQLNPFTNPARLTAGGMFGAGVGGLAEEIGSRFPGRRTTLSYDAETDALLKRYRSLAGPRRRRR